MVCIDSLAKAENQSNWLMNARMFLYILTSEDKVVRSPRSEDGL